ncbi:MAG: uncharacterized protein KVP18_002676 [Porospora cf. gigantea A]|uniref:uncharacterized protein n=1 Tax=Porospora cf. gigantea A TaxID=2853593 RepID=UPI00355A42B4|nr:MAG: hypothetical protein KVP18_002676 [Porospora cf. gigantea A]
MSKWDDFDPSAPFASNPYADIGFDAEVLGPVKTKSQSFRGGSTERLADSPLLLPNRHAESSEKTHARAAFGARLVDPLSVARYGSVRMKSKGCPPRREFQYVIQLDKFFILSKDMPVVMEAVIPLVNVVTVQSKGARVEIQWLRRRRKAKTRTVQTLLEAESVTEAEHLVEALTKMTRIAKGKEQRPSHTKNFPPLVELENIEARYRAEQQAARAAAAAILGSLAFSVMQNVHRDRLLQAWSRLRHHAVSQSAARDRVAFGRREAQQESRHRTDLEQMEYERWFAERKANFHIAADILNELQTKRMRRFLVELFTETQKRHLRQIQSEMHDRWSVTFTAISTMEAQILRRHRVLRLRSLFTMWQRKMLFWGFHGLRNPSRWCRKDAMNWLVRRVTVHHDQCCRLVMAQWQKRGSAENLRQQSVLRLVQRRAGRSSSWALRRWITVVLYLQDRDTFGILHLTWATQRIYRSVSCSALRALSDHAQEEVTTEALQVASSLTRLNQHYVYQARKGVPQEMSCRRMVTFLQSRVEETQKEGLSLLQLHVAQKVSCEMRCLEGNERLRALTRRRLRRTFRTLYSHSSRCWVSIRAVALGLHTLEEFVKAWNRKLLLISLFRVTLFRRLNRLQLWENMGRLAEGRNAACARLLMTLDSVLKRRCCMSVSQSFFKLRNWKDRVNSSFRLHAPIIANVVTSLLRRHRQAAKYHAFQLLRYDGSIEADVDMAIIELDTPLNFPFMPSLNMHLNLEDRPSSHRPFDADGLPSAVNTADFNMELIASPTSELPATAPDEVVRQAPTATATRPPKSTRVQGAGDTVNTSSRGRGDRQHEFKVQGRRDNLQQQPEFKGQKRRDTLQQQPDHPRQPEFKVQGR